MTTDEERDRAAEARHGGAVIRDHLTRLGHAADMDNVAYWARHLAAGSMARSRSGTMYEPTYRYTLPEAAFDWPIYRAALAPVVGMFAAIDPTETFEPDGPPDAYWQDADDSRYRADMRDAGRGGVVRW